MNRAPLIPSLSFAKMNTHLLIFSSLALLSLSLGSLSYAADPPAAQSTSESPTKMISLGDDGVISQVLIGGIGDRGTPRLMGVAIGDLNGDGIDDLVLGAPGYDPDGQEGAGSVFILFGRSDLLSTSSGTIDLSEIKNFDLRIDGVRSQSKLGTRIVIGDFDGDEIADLIFTAPGSASAVQGPKGTIYIHKGSKVWPKGVISITDSNAFDIAFEGAKGSLLGATLCAADINQDQRIDLVFGGLEYNDQHRLRATALYIVPGRTNWSQRTYRKQDHIPGGVRLFRTSSTKSMHTCVIGDFDQDGAGDLVAGMPNDQVGERTNVGSVSIVMDVLAQVMGSIDLGEMNKDAGIRLTGPQQNSLFGASLVVADFNADGVDDLAIGSPGFRSNPKGEGAPEGAVFLFNGKMDKASPPNTPDLLMRGTPETPFGSHLRSPDVNGDGRADLVILSPRASSYSGPQTGSAHIFLTGSHLHTGEKYKPNTPPDYILRGSVQGERLGFEFESGDLNGDGNTDWILRSSSNAKGRHAAGSFQIFTETSSILQGTDLLTSQTPHWTILGPGRGGSITRDIAASRDLDGDGILDLLWRSPEGAGFGGLGCLQLSSKNRTGKHSMRDAGSCDLRIITPAGTHLSSIDLGDFDNDGKVDVVLGMDNHLVNGQPVGAVAIFPLPDVLEGTISLDDPPASTRWWLGGKGTEALGREVTLADADNDGIDDLMMAAPLATFDDLQNAGAILIVKGGEPGPKTSNMTRGETTGPYLFRFEGPENSQLGPDSRLLDFDGDGKVDLLGVASHAAGGGRPGAGTAYMVYNLTRLSNGTHEMIDNHVAPLQIFGPNSRASLGHPSEVQDLDGDGIDDLLFEAPTAQYDGATRGAVYGIYGRRERIAPVLDLESPGSSDFAIFGERFAKTLRGPAVGDINGDGTMDLVVASPWAGEHGQGRVYVLLGKPGQALKGIQDLSTRSAEVIAWILNGHESHGGLIVPNALIDTNADGSDDLWLISPYSDDTRSDQGKAQLISIPWSAP